MTRNHFEDDERDEDLEDEDEDEDEDETNMPRSPYGTSIWFPASVEDAYGIARSGKILTEENQCHVRFFTEYPAWGNRSEVTLLFTWLGDCGASEKTSEHLADGKLWWMYSSLPDGSRFHLESRIYTSLPDHADVSARPYLVLRGIIQEKRSSLFARTLWERYRWRRMLKKTLLICNRSRSVYPHIRTEPRSRSWFEERRMLDAEMGKPRRDI